LLDYWIDISKRPSLTLEDYELFFERITESMRYFEEFYGGRSPPEKFLEWPAPGSEDTELGVLMELEVCHGETEVYPRVQA
jgi:hypothetical protein